MAPCPFPVWLYWIYSFSVFPTTFSYLAFGVVLRPCLWPKRTPVTTWATIKYWVVEILWNWVQIPASPFFLRQVLTNLAQAVLELAILLPEPSKYAIMPSSPCIFLILRKSLSFSEPQFLIING
jgi:hypothetical protein